MARVEIFPKTKCHSAMASFGLFNTGDWCKPGISQKRGTSHFTLVQEFCEIRKATAMHTTLRRGARDCTTFFDTQVALLTF